MSTPRVTQPAMSNQPTPQPPVSLHAQREAVRDLSVTLHLIDRRLRRVPDAPFGSPEDKAKYERLARIVIGMQDEQRLAIAALVAANFISERFDVRGENSLDIVESVLSSFTSDLALERR